MEMTDEETRIHDLERAVAELSNLVIRLQQLVKKAGEYKNDDPAKELEGTKYLLAQAADIKGRPARRRRR